MEKKQDGKTAIANTLKSYRVRAGFTQRDVGAMTGKASQTVASWESGKGQPDIDTFIYLCYTYGICDILKEFGYKIDKSLDSTSSTRYILSGIGKDYNNNTTGLTDEERLLLIQFRKMSSLDRKMAFSMFRAILENRDNGEISDIDTGDISQ